MTKRPPVFVAAIIATNLFMLIFIVAMILGASYTAISLLVLFTEGFTEALPHFLTGIGLIGFGYLVNVLLTYILTKKWSWRITNKYEFTEVPKKSKSNTNKKDLL